MSRAGNSSDYALPAGRHCTDLGHSGCFWLPDGSRTAQQDRLIYPHQPRSHLGALQVSKEESQSQGDHK